MNLCPFCNRRTINLLDDDDDDGVEKTPNFGAVLAQKILGVLSREI